MTRRQQKQPTVSSNKLFDNNDNVFSTSYNRIIVDGSTRERPNKSGSV